MCFWWSLCTLYLHVCQVRVTVGDSGLCCCACDTYLERQLTPLCVDYDVGYDRPIFIKISTFLLFALV